MNDYGLNYSALMMGLLDFLGRDPDTFYHVREISRLTGISVGAVSMTLHGMESTHMVDGIEKGGLKLYRFNMHNPVSRQFKVLFTITWIRGLVEELREHSLRIILYGSSAEGTDAKDSDIDLFVETQDPRLARTIVRRWQDRFEKQYNRTLSPLIVDPIEMARLRRQDKPLIENIYRGRTLWPRD